jgi:hypothetical protein
MTLRDYVERRRTIIFLPFMIAEVIEIALVFLGQPLPLGVIRAILLATPLVGVIVASRVACPVCREAIGGLRLRSINGKVIPDARCPNCRASLNEPMP